VRVLVTGVAGFLGSFLAEFLVGRGFDVVGVDNLSFGRLENLSRLLGDARFRFVWGDLLVPDSWVGVLDGVGAVFHFAANPEVRHSVAEPLSHFSQNVTATAYLLEAARRRGVEVFVFASSSTVYGDPVVVPTPEDHPLRPISVYGATKVMGEVLCLTYARLFGMRCLVLRFANIVGPRLRHGVIYDFIRRLRAGSGRLEILGDGSQRKSYLYVDDAVEATFRAFERVLRDDVREAVYNVGNVDWVSVREIADIVVRVLGLGGVEYVFRPGTPDGRGWPGDVKLMLLDITRISRDTGWRPRYSSAESVELAAKHLAEELRS